MSYSYPYRKREQAAEKLRLKQQKTDKVTRIIALIVAFVGVFFFFIKLLFL